MQGAKDSSLEEGLLLSSEGEKDYQGASFGGLIAMGKKEQEIDINNSTETKENNHLKGTLTPLLSQAPCNRLAFYISTGGTLELTKFR